MSPGVNGAETLKLSGIALLVLLLSTGLVASVREASAYAPKNGDSFDYSETITVNNGQGSYSGYTDQTLITGGEVVNHISGSNVSTSYHYSYEFSNDQGSSTLGSTSGEYTWSSSSFTYLNGTDNQTGYSKPTYVWFAMNPSLPVGGVFYALNTQLTVLSKNYNLRLPTAGNAYVQTILARGSGVRERDDAYGVFSASYTWSEYFDPTTGYIIGYTYVEQDTGQYQGQSGSFTYSDNLYVTATSYFLSSGSAPGGGAGATNLTLNAYLGLLIVIAVVLFVVLAVVLTSRGRKRRESLPKHSPTPPPTPASPYQAPRESTVDLGSRPPEQVVIREVAKVNCKYCGTLIPTTADVCPYCGGPRQ